ncbi:MAG: response regulator, partial [Planctomycetes bacterium]|nr:response regulator [Planctomycetota bacterium]
ALTEGGYEVMEAVDGQDCVDQLGGKAVDLFITDLNMPRLDGIGLIKAIRAHAAHRGVPIVMLTTESDQNKKMEGKAAGATAWIVKPFQSAQLLAVVKKILG